MTVCAIVGAQYGSEGKGVIANHLANEYDIHTRTGGPNAGHSFVFKGQVFKMQAIPCGWTNPDALIIIGRGGLLNLDVFQRELEQIKVHYPDIEDRIVIDSRAGILDRCFAEEEGHTQGEIHQRIGSTGEGVGAARVARIGRDPGRFRLARDVPEISHLLGDTVEYLHYAIGRGEKVLLEGTQGSALSMVHGPWPFVTSADTNAGQMLADVGIAPGKLTDVILVARTFPIRVAGNSGPMREEITWDRLTRDLGRPVQERTTVTRKVRRVGRWDPDLIGAAVMLNAPTQIALTFIDYLSSMDSGKTRYEDLSFGGRQFVEYVEQTWETPVTLIGTGGFEANGQFNLIDRRGGNHGIPV